MEFLPIFLHILFFTSAYAAPQLQYFINCGSSTTTTLDDNRNFVGDVKPTTFHLCTHHSKTVKNTTQLPLLPDSTDVSLLYTTARVFSQTSTYVFNIQQTGIYILRFHFFPFSSSPKLSEAQFDVSASGHMLLPGFTVGKNATDSIILKEFFIDINITGDFRVYFMPNNVASSVAFVNAIELFNTSLNFTQDKVQKSNVLETIHRINVGDMQVNSSEDTLWRSWVLDDQYLINKGDAQNSIFYAQEINYKSVPAAATVNDAPVFVYKTAKTLKHDVTSNLTWKLNVSKGEKHLVRMHFCDIVSALGTYNMNIYIDAILVEKLDPYSITSFNPIAVPFYRDYIVETGNLEFINISVGPVKANVLYLNGLEIMQYKNGTAPDPIDHGGSHLRVIVYLIVASIVLIVVVVGVALFYMKKRKEVFVEESEWEMVHMYGATSHNRSSERSPSSHASNVQNLHLGLKIPFLYIQKVTNNFDASLIIGEGGFGKVYKAVFKNGLKVAVKRSSPDHGQGLEEFQTEIMVLSKIRHRHLVSLIGYCYEDDEMILVYEFMEKGTLRDHLYDSRGIAISSNCLGLSWKQRLEICIGAAKGLHYLHTGSDGGIIHRDVKSTNILLDEHYVAKVADFGLSRLGYLEQTQINTDVKGTFGYLDPEYIISMQLTEKSDVYSFGVVLLEVLCARAVINCSLPKEQVNLAEWAMTCVEQEKVEDIIDPSIVGEVTQNALKKFVEAAVKCLKDSSDERPTMSDVIWDLEYALQLQRAATEEHLPDDTDTMTDASLNLPLPADQVFSFQSISDVKDDVTIISTGEVFSQLNLDDDTGR